jgi:HEAT repeat protein
VAGDDEERRAARLVTLLGLVEHATTAAELSPFLGDLDAAVRRRAIAVLVDAAPPDAALALVCLLLDDDATVRAAAVDGLERLPAPARAVAGDVLRQALGTASRSPHVEVRAAVVRLWLRFGLASVDAYASVAGDKDAAVRIEAVAGLVALGAADELALLHEDPEVLVRLAVARGLGQVGDPSSTDVLEHRAWDPDLRVRTAAIESFAGIGLGPSAELVVTAAVRAPHWQIRRAAAIALGAARPAVAVGPLLRAAGDENEEVRKVAVLALAPWVGELDEVRGAVEAATADPDAEVRGCARGALT